MKVVPLGDLIKPASAVRAGAGSYPVYSMTMHSGLIPQGEKFKKNVSSSDTSSYKIVHPGQLVVGFPIDEGVLDVLVAEGPVIVSPAYAIWDFNSAKVDGNYLSRFLRSQTAITYYEAKLQGSTARRRSLPRPVFEALAVPLPVLAEQRRIADILDLCAGLERLHRATTSLLAELESTLVLDHTKSDLSQPIRLSDLGRISTGKTPPTSDDSNFGGRIPFVTPGDLGIEHATSRHLSESGASQARLVRSGSTLVCCIGTIGKVGMASETSAFNQQINAIEWDEELVDDIYGMLAMRSLAKVIAARGTSTTLPIINKTDFSALTLQLPALSVQRQAAAKWKCINNLRAQHNRALTEVRLQQASLAYRAFKGEL